MVGVSVMHHSHSTTGFRGPAHYNTHTYTCSTCLAHLLRSPLSRVMSSRIHINGLQQYDDTDWSPDYSTCWRKSHPKSCEQHNSLHRPNSTARGNSPLKTTQFLDLKDTENIVVRKEAQESSVQRRISEKVARGDLHTRRAEWSLCAV